MSATNFSVGTEVGAKRWPNSAAHPLVWTTPRKGIVVAHDDPRAWANTLAFPGRTPTIEEARAHVADLRSRGMAPSDVPVLWDFGTEGEKVYFEPAEKLRSYAEDVAEWEEAREKCLFRYRGKVRA